MRLRCTAAAVVLFGCIGCSGETRAPAAGDTSAVLAGEPPVAESGASASSAPLTVSTFGIGRVRAGMTVRDASALLDGALVARSDRESTACDYLTWRNGPPGVKVMTERGSIARVEVDSGATTTDVGARIGDSEARIRELYGNRVRVEPHKYTTGRYLIVTPADVKDTLFRLVFETDGRRVTRFRSGVLPPVLYVEGCG